MKVILAIFFFSPLCFNAQQRQTNFYHIDNKVGSIPFARADVLAKQLAAVGKNDIEKVRAIFRWITENIDYNVRIFNRNKTTPGLFYEEPDDSTAPLPSLNERVAAKVLYRRIAFCDGYARLFKTLCDHAGIKAEIINGYARTNTAKRFAVNHTWNAVFIDSSWHLLDVTWASGFITYGNEYVRRYNDLYFLTPPNEFVKDHYPEEIQWTLMTEPPLYREFNQSPFRLSGFIKAGISNFFPAKGILDVAVGDTILVELKSKRQLRSFFVSESPVLDTTQASMMSMPGAGEEKVFFKHNITSSTGEWLYVFCNDELALRYKLNIKRNTAASNLTGFLNQ